MIDKPIPRVCVVCNRELKPQTTVPRWDVATRERFKESYEKAKRDQASERALGKVGLFGEARFCNATCAAFYGRAAIRFVLADRTGCGAGIHRLLLTYPWVTKRRSKK